MLRQYLNNDEWNTILEHEFGADYFRILESKLAKLYERENVFPKKERVFAAMNALPPAKVKVILLGQDPYHQVGQANGLAFSVSKGTKIPPSLRNIFKELKEDIGCSIPSHGDLQHWARQGVLLLNTTLTVTENKPSSHRAFGWEVLTNSIVSRLSEREEPVVFVLWGNHARTKAPLIRRAHHKILEAAHPSPLSAYKGFFGCKHFSKVNQFLNSTGQDEIDWDIPV